MKSVLVVFLSLLIVSCVNNQVIRLVDSNGIVSTNYPKIKIKVNDTELTPVLNHQSDSLNSYKFTSSGRGTYLEPDANGSPNMVFNYYIYAYYPSNLLKKSLRVSFDSLLSRSRWSKSINREDTLMSGRFKHKTGTYRTAIYYDYYPNYKAVNNLSALDKGTPYDISPCYLHKVYQHVLKGIQKKKISITYSEYIECNEAESFSNDYGLTTDAKKYLTTFDIRANESFMLEELQEG